MQGTKSFVVFIFCCVSFPGRQIETLLVVQAGHQPEASVYDDLGTRPNIDYCTGCTFKIFKHSPHFVYQPCQSLSQGVYHFTGQTNCLLIRSWFKDSTAIIHCFTVLCQLVPPSCCFEHNQTDAHKKKIAFIINKIACYQKLKEKQTNCCPCDLQMVHKDLYICHNLLILPHP